MKRLIKKSEIDYIEKYGAEKMDEIETDIGSWISGGRSWFDNPDEVVEEWISMFPDFTYSGEAYRMLAFDRYQFISAINKTFNINISNLDEVNDELKDIIVSADNLQTICNNLVNINNDYVSWTKNKDKHNQFHNFYKDFNGNDYYLISIKSNVSGFYITEFNLYLQKALFDKSKEEYDETTLKYDGVNYSDQDEVIAPTTNIELNMINEVPFNNLVNLNLLDFIEKSNIK